MEIKLQQKLSQQLVMTPQLQQAIKLLQLNRLELIDMVREEMMENPILEDQADDPEVRPTSDSVETPSIDQLAAIEERRDQSPTNPEEQRAASESREEEYWERFLESYSNQAPLPSTGSRSSSEELPSLEATLSTRTSLADHLVWQLRLSPLSDVEFKFAMLVINNLDESGYLNLRAIEKDKPSRAEVRAAVAAAAEEARDLENALHGIHDEPAASPERWDADGHALPEPHRREKKVKEPVEHIEPPSATRTRALTIEDLAIEVGLDPEDAEEVLKLIQTLDPVGVASRDLRECLLVQAEAFGYDRETSVWQVIDRHLPNVEKRNFGAIARDLKCELDEIYDASKLISTLEPRPGRNFATEDPPYITPDVYVAKVGEEYVVTTNDDGLPKLKINVEQATALMKDPKAKEFVQSKLASARWFVRSLDQRHKTIVKVTQSIVEKQRDFFERGIEHLKPMILRDVAESVGMHESTISRVTTNKYVHTPRGIFELKYFFNSSIRRIAEEDIASESVKQAIKKIIGEEDSKNPLSDEQIVKKLEEHRIMIARRTVAKYREMLGILSSAKRKHYY
ncbi:MAG: RNA polymerase factor sigma-54 [Deltaproteobacteria bacterium]